MMDNSPRRFVSSFEPFRIKSVEKIKTTTREERLKYLKEAHYNPFMVQSEHVLIDLLTDSGTGAMSTGQWSAMMLGDEMYAGSSSYKKFETVVKEIFGYRHVLPTHQGRAAERILFHCTLSPEDIVPNNSHFDTTRANVEAKEAIALNLPCPEAFDPNSDYPFKGDMALKGLEDLLSGDRREHVRLVFLTITNNALGGFPVSMANIKAVSKLCHAYNKPLFFDACRFAENAWFIKTKEEGYEAKTPKEIACEIFSLGDGCTMSAKKNGLCNIGGFLAMNDDDVADRCRTELVISEGFVTYGGLAGRDLEAIAVGFQEILEDSYLEYQINFVKNLAEMLKDHGVPVLTPPSGHAVYIDAAAMLPHIPKDQFPAWSLFCALYLEGGVRGVEIGGVMFGGAPNNNQEEESVGGSEPELLRLAIPRRVYTESHMRYVAEVLGYIAKQPHDIPGYRITWEAKALRHFTARLSPVLTEFFQDKGVLKSERGEADNQNSPKSHIPKRKTSILIMD